MSRVLAESFKTYYQVEGYFTEGDPSDPELNQPMWVRNGQKHPNPEEAREAAKILKNAGPEKVRVIGIKEQTKEVVLDEPTNPDFRQQE